MRASGGAGHFLSMGPSKSDMRSILSAETLVNGLAGIQLQEALLLPKYEGDEELQAQIDVP